MALLLERRLDVIGCQHEISSVAGWSVDVLECKCRINTHKETFQAEIPLCQASSQAAGT